MSLLTNQTLNKMKVLSAKEEQAMTHMANNVKGGIKDTADALSTLSVRPVECIQSPITFLHFAFVIDSREWNDSIPM